MVRYIIFIILILPLSLAAQRWALRPEICLTAAKAKFVSNTNPYPPFRSTYSNNPDIYLNADYYLKKNRDRLTITLGTYQNKFSVTYNGVRGNGYLGFIAPDYFLSQGTLGSVYIGVGYAKALLNKNARNDLFLIGGLQYYFIRPIGNPSASGPDGSFVLHKTEMKRVSSGNLGWHTGIIALVRNRNQREVLQFSFKYNGTFNTTQFTNDYYYSMITPTDPPEIIKDQVLRYRLTGAGIQLGISKTLIYFPKQRNMKKG